MKEAEIANSMDHSPPLESDSRSAGQEIPCVLQAL
jgi:hypothetical protein